MKKFLHSTGYLLLLTLFTVESLSAQQLNRSFIDVSVTPDHSDWTYKTGETARFNVAVLRAGHPVDGATVRYEVGPELMTPASEGALELKDGRAVVDGGTLSEPGFIRMTVIADYEGKTYRGFGTAGFAPENIEPAAVLPEDFEAFWQAAIEEARTVPLQPTLTLLPDASTSDVKVYHVSYQNEKRGSRIYGMLSVPAAPGKYPAILSVPGAGVRPYTANIDAARRGLVHLSIGIHGIPVDLDPDVYLNLASGALTNYWASGIQSPDSYYYRRVILGAVRAGDFIATLPEFDGEHYGVYGGSQGGALSIITAALDERIDALAAVHPALSDHEGFLHGRAGGWPHLFAPWNNPEGTDPKHFETVRYYDVVNFARLLDVPGHYTWGFNDTVCPPTSMYAAYNVISSPKELFLIQETGHWTYPEQWDRIFDFLVNQLAE